MPPLGKLAPIFLNSSTTIRGEKKGIASIFGHSTTNSMIQKKKQTSDGSQKKRECPYKFQQDSCVLIRTWSFDKVEMFREGRDVLIRSRCVEKEEMFREGKDVSIRCGYFDTARVNF